ncbi:MAG: pyridoxamine 5-phosphate oxidase-related, FMN-binding protein, partial [Acidimicrobiia bacterium]|nr:pyridoxamine 5-phosphate oxidase-related, FMN-binding protein [Acidimicrobiia bacterium]
ARAVAVAVVWSGAELVLHVGQRTASNIEAQPLVTLLFAAPDTASMSLIVDGVAHVDEQQVRFRPTSAVLHRPAPPAAG